MSNFPDHDGPYIFQESHSQEMLYADCGSNGWNIRNVPVSDSFEVNAMLDPQMGYSFQFELELFPDQLRSHLEVESERMDLPKKVLAISDIEGNFIALYSWLLANEAIDQHANWIYEDGHLVLVGDIMDRGDQVTQLLWLIYKLQYQAERDGGKVHALIGNHDAMNFHMDLRYVHPKYKSLGRHLVGSEITEDNYSFLWNRKNLHYSWMKNWPSIIQMGKILFVHAGISQDLVDSKLSIMDINKIASHNVDKDIYRPNDVDELAKLVVGRMGPWWFRGMVDDYSGMYDKISEASFARILDHFKASKIIVGHTVQNDISTGFDERIIMIDVLHGWEVGSGKTRGILIEDQRIFSVDDRGSKSVLCRL